jgi:hypothetical protein
VEDNLSTIEQEEVEDLHVEDKILIQHKDDEIVSYQESTLK